MVRKRYGWIRRWAAAAAAACLALTGLGFREAAADSMTEDGLKYFVMRGEATITGFDPGTRRKLEARLAAEAAEAGETQEEEASKTGPGKKGKEKELYEIVIPESVGDIPVTTIGKRAFQNSRGYISGVTIPASVTLIGDSAFRDCEELVSLTFSERTEELTLGADAFSGCIALKEAVIPEGVTSLPRNLFAGCRKLRKITIAKSVKEIGDGAFEGTALRSAPLPRGLERVGNRAFRGTNIRQIILYENLKEIGEEGFPETVQLLIKSENPDGIQLAEGRYDYVVYTSKNKEAVINRYSVSGDIIAVPDTIAGYPIVGFDGDAFESGKKLAPDPAGTSALLLSAAGYPVYSSMYPEMALEIRKPSEEAETEIRLVRYEGNDAAVTVPYGVTDILAGAFGGKEAVKALRLPETVKRIETGALSGLTGVENVYLPGGGVSVPEGELPGKAFFWCDEGVETVRSLAEAGYTVGAMDMIFEGIGDEDSAGPDESGVRLASYHGSGLEVEIPDFVTEIGSGAFRRQTRLTDVRMGDGVLRIGSEAFLGCSKLETVLPGRGLIEIGEKAFAECGKLENIYLPEMLRKIGAGAFDGCEALEWLLVPESVTEIGEKAFPEPEKAAPENKTAETGEKAEYEGLTILAAENSAAREYAEASGIRWLAVHPEDRTLTLPEETIQIEEEAFLSAAAWQVTVPEGCEKIGDRAFAESGIRIAVIPASVKAIGKNAFEGTDALIICEYDSYADDWSEKHGMIRVLKAPETGNTSVAAAGQPEADEENSEKE